MSPLFGSHQVAGCWGKASYTKPFHFSVGRRLNGQKRRFSIPFSRRREEHAFLTLFLNCPLEALDRRFPFGRPV